MTARILFAALLLPPLSLPAAQTPRREEKARDALEAYLAKVPGAKAGKLLAVTDDAVTRPLATSSFYAVRFRGYPMKPPAPYKTSNLFAVAADGTVKPLADEKALKEFFRTALSPVGDDAEAKAALKAWLRLAEELHQDGYFTFKRDEDSLQVRSHDGKRTVSGKARATEGGEGQISATLTFDKDGKLAEATTEASVKAGGARPAGGRP